MANQTPHIELSEMSSRSETFNFQSFGIGLVLRKAKNQIYLLARFGADFNK